MNKSFYILKKIKSGEEDGYKLLFQNYYSDLVLFANSIVNDTHASEDIIQEFFIDFWFDKKYQIVKTDLDGYLFKSIKNICLNYLRSEKRKSKRLEDIIINDHYQFKFNIEELEEKEEIYKAINRLPEQCKKVFTYCCINGLKYQETADELDVSINTVRTQMGRAFKFLRESLDRSVFSLIILFGRSDLKYLKE